MSLHFVLSEVYQLPVLETRYSSIARLPCQLQHRRVSTAAQKSHQQSMVVLCLISSSVLAGPLFKIDLLLHSSALARHDNAQTTTKKVVYGVWRQKIMAGGDESVSLHYCLSAPTAVDWAARQTDFEGPST